MTSAPQTQDQFVPSDGEDWKKRLKSYVVFLEVVALFAAAALSYLSWTAAESATKKTILAQTEVSGNQTWSSYRDLEAEFQKQFGSAYSYLNKDEVANVRYRQLNERLLMTADLIAFQKEVDPGWSDPQWGDSFGAEFLKHRDYFLSDTFLRNANGLMSQFCTYRSEVRNWVAHAFARDTQATLKISVAIAACNEMCSGGRKCT